MLGHAEPAHDGMLISQQTAVLQAIHNRLAEGNALARDLRLLQAATFLENSAVALDLMQMLGFADLQFFDTAPAVAALATSTAFTLRVPNNSVGFWRDLTITPDQSNVFVMTVAADGQQLINDPSLVARTIISESQWLPFKSNFTITLRNTDGVGPHTATIIGTRAFLQVGHWQRIQTVLNSAIQAITGDQPYPSKVP